MAGVRDLAAAPAQAPWAIGATARWWDVRRELKFDMSDNPLELGDLQTLFWTIAMYLHFDFIAGFYELSARACPCRCRG
jgi:hypothetical protein